MKYHKVVEAFEGQNSKLKSLKIGNLQTGESDQIHPAAAFIFIGQLPNSSFLKGHADLDSRGFVLTGYNVFHMLRKEHMALDSLPFDTSILGIFAAGDVRHGSTEQVASAVGEGAAASISIREFLRRSEGVAVA